MKNISGTLIFTRSWPHRTPPQATARPAADEGSDQKPRLGARNLHEGEWEVARCGLIQTCRACLTMFRIKGPTSNQCSAFFL